MSSRATPRAEWRNGTARPGTRLLPEEVPVALVFNGTTQAVMMATPADLEDFALGFALSEGIARPDEVRELEVVAQETGWEARLWLAPEAEARFAARRRATVGPVGCGLCGIDSLEQALRPLPVSRSALNLRAEEVPAAMEALKAGQRLHEATRATHAAGFWRGGMVAVREDVGRHNALDKLIGALMRGGERPETGALVITSRVSVDMVQKAATCGAPVLIAAAAPTALAVAEAERAGLTLISSVRGADFDVYTHDSRIRDRIHAA